MSGLALFLHDLGHYIIGSDTEIKYKTEDLLRERSIEILLFDKANITNKYIYIISNAYDESHVEVEEVIIKQYEYYYYHEFIKTINKYQIAISGTHGKTTTTSLICTLLSHLKTGCLIGCGYGRADFDYNYLIYEACEYRDHFLAYRPDILVINNIEMDHPDYFKNLDDVIDSFQKAANNASLLIINGDEINTKKIKHHNKITFGLNKECDIYASIIEKNQMGYLIKIVYQNIEEEYHLPFCGDHMIYNFLAGYTVAKNLDIKKHMIESQLKEFKLPSKRREKLNFKDKQIIIDYAHHPTEIKALIKSLRQECPNDKIIAIFQPHTYSRTIALLDEFVEALDKFDEIFIEKVFTSSRESENSILQIEIDKAFKKYHIFKKEILTEINCNNNAIWVVLGAGNLDLLIQ